MLIAFAAEQKLDEGSGGALQTLWLQPRFSPTIPAPHSHCSAHPALPSALSAATWDRGQKEAERERERDRGKKVFRKVFTGYWDNSKKQQVVVNFVILSVAFCNNCADISWDSRQNLKLFITTRLI